MLFHYFKLAIRNSLKQRSFSAINVFGLALGLACFLLMGAYTWQEFQVNKSLRNADQQYILQSKWKQEGMGLDFTTIGQLPLALRAQYPHLVANYYRFDGISSTVSRDNELHRETLQVGDSTLLEMYGFDLKYGEEKTALIAPFSLVISTEKARKYFDKEDVVGEVLLIENFSGERQNFTITGVLEKPEWNTVTSFNSNNDSHFFIPTNTLEFFGRNIDNWANTITLGFVELSEGVEASDLEEPMQQLIANYTPAYIAANLEPYLLPLSNYYLDTNNGHIRRMLYTLTGITLFILLMAIINFVNIAVSQTNLRLKEIGVRKVLGGLRSSLMAQFYMEAFLLTGTALLFSLVIYYYSSPIVSAFLTRSIPSLTQFGWSLLPLLLGLTVLISLLAGTYPAILLSSFTSVQALKGHLGKVQDKAMLRKGLMGFQFMIAAGVLICSTIITQQVDYFFSKDLGYSKDLVIYAPVARDWTAEGVTRMEQIRKQLHAIPEIQQISLSYSIPTGNNAGQPALYRFGADSTTAISSTSVIVDRHYTSTYDISVVAGTFFQAAVANGSRDDIVINAAAAKALGWQNPEEAVGQRVRIINRTEPLQIKGVVADYHFGSLREAIKPAVFMNVENANIYRYFSMKLQTDNMEEALTGIQQKWSEFQPNTPFEFQFLDESLANLYTAELRLKRAANVAGILAMVIALLGIFGLLAISLERRTKEIGIRKVIGAEMPQILYLFLKEFLPVVLLAGLIACPLSWYLIQEWLKDYSYQISVTAIPFALTLCFLLVLSTTLISLQCYRTSTMNPVDAIREE